MCATRAVSAIYSFIYCVSSVSRWIVLHTKSIVRNAYCTLHRIRDIDSNQRFNSSFFVLCFILICFLLFFYSVWNFILLCDCATKKVVVLFLAIVAVAFAVATPAAIPQSSVNVPSAIEIPQQLENRKNDPMSEGVEPNSDLKASSSYGYGFYGPYSYGYYGSPYSYRYGILFKNQNNYIITYSNATN